MSDAKTKGGLEKKTERRWLDSVGSYLRANRLLDGMRMSPFIDPTKSRIKTNRKKQKKSKRVLLLVATVNDVVKVIMEII